MTPTEMTTVSEAEEWTERKFANAPSSHAWDHTKRVYENAVTICRAEGGDEYLVRLATLFHDLGRIPEAKGGLYRGRPVKSYRGHSAMSLFEAREMIDWLEENGLLTRAQCAELRYIIYQHSRLPTKSPRQTKNLTIVKDADMIDSFGYEGVLRNLSHSKRDGDPLWAPGLTIDFPEDRALTIPEGCESWLGNLQFVYNFNLMIVFEISRRLAEPKLRINRDLLSLLKQQIRRNDWRDYDFWNGFVNWAKDKHLPCLTDANLKEFEQISQ